MPESDGRTYRTHYRAAPGDAELREHGDEVDGDDGLMSIRLPIASTGEVRNEGDEPLTRSELRGMAEQIDEGRVGVFPEHGSSDAVDGGRYSQFEKLGYWSNAEVQSEQADDGSDLLMATAVMPEPRSLPAATGDYREALATLKSQVEAGVPVDASIGWREDEGFPGGNDLMEASIVGIGADPRTNTAGADPVEMVARAAVDVGADPEALVDAVRDAVDTEGERPLGPPEDPDRFETFDECVTALSDDGDTSREDAERICGAWESEKDEQAATQNLDDPEFAEGDAVSWNWQGDTVHGRVAGIHEQFTPDGADEPITGDEGEAVYSIHEWDEDVEAFRRENVAKPQSSLSESQMDMPPATEENFQSMDTDSEDTTDEQDANGTDADREVTPDTLEQIMDLAEEVVADHTEAMIDDLRTRVADEVDVAESQEMDGDEEDDEDEEMDGEMDADDPDAEQSADDAAELRSEIEALREELDDVRSGEADVADPDADADEQDRDADDGATETRDPAESTSPFGGY